jgi:hypothetical protein
VRANRSPSVPADALRRRMLRPTDRELAVAHRIASLLVVHAQREGCHSRMPRTRPCQQARDQHASAGHQLLGVVGAGEQFDALLEGRRQRDGLARVGCVAARTIEVGQQRRTEAPRQAGARQVCRSDSCFRPCPAGFPVLTTRSPTARPVHRRAGDAARQDR